MTVLSTRKMGQGMPQDCKTRVSGCNKRVLCTTYACDAAMNCEGEKLVMVHGRDFQTCTTNYSWIATITFFIHQTTPHHFIALRHFFPYPPILYHDLYSLGHL